MQHLRTLIILAVALLGACDKSKDPDGKAAPAKPKTAAPEEAEPKEAEPKQAEPAVAKTPDDPGAPLTIEKVLELARDDQPEIANKRIRVEGLNVLSMGGSVEKPDKTLVYSVGIEASPDNADLRLKCQTSTKPPELSGGDPIILEGVVHAGTDPWLTDCTVTKK